jgi:predicted unusual protein kinase regulating ubiquinone biosynthesis (AarF/ABC1/UbiB family)
MYKNKTKNLFRKAISGLILLSFLSGQIWTPSMAQAQSIPGLNLPMPGEMVGISPSYVPVAIKGLKVFPDNPFRFDFILDTGNSKFEGQKLKDETNLLIKYFLTALTVPDDDQWVNLSPYEKDRVIPKEFGITEMGRDLLAQDYLLKQLTASLIYPEHELGKKFWERVHQKAYEKYGDINIPMSTFNKVWIMPDHAKVYENGTMAFITESHLKVMLDADYLALKENLNDPKFDVSKQNAKDVNAVSSAVVREVVLPEIEKEVNEGKNFTKLRQVYQSMIMAAWFKRKLKDGMLGKIYVGANKVSGVDVEDKEVKQKIYDQYLAAFKQGVYNYIREDYDERTQEATPRKYFSGGFQGNKVLASTEFVPTSREKLGGAVSSSVVGKLVTASSALTPVNISGVTENKPKPVSAPVSDYDFFIRNEIETNQMRFGFVEESHPVFIEVNQIFQKVRKATGWADNLTLRIINSDDINAYWMTDSGDFFITTGIIKALKNFLESKGKKLTQDHIAWIIGHEQRHREQHLQGKDKITEDESKNERTIRQNMEYDADTGGLFLAAFAGFNPRVAVDVLEFLDNLGDIPFMGSHPKSDNRIGEVQQILQSPDVAVPNINKSYQDFSEPFLADGLMNNATRSTEFHEQMLEADSLDALMAHLDSIDDPVKLEEFLTHYYFRMLYDFSAGVAESQDFQRYLSFALTANNVAVYLENWLHGSLLSGQTRWTFEREWGIPVSISKLFQYFSQQGPGAGTGEISALGGEVGLSRDKIVEGLLKQIDKELDRLQNGGMTNGRDRETVISALQAMKRNLVQLLQKSQDRKVTRAKNLNEGDRFFQHQVFPSLEAAEEKIGKEMIISSKKRNDGSYYVEYLDAEQILQNMEKFWEFFDESYDRSRNETRDRQRRAVAQVGMLGLKDWMKKRYGKLELPPLLADIESNANGDITAQDVEDRQRIEQGRSEFLPLYLRALAFYFLNNNIGAFGNSTNKSFPMNESHLTRLKQKFIQITRNQFANKNLDEEQIELLAMVRYMSFFRGFNANIDGQIETLIQRLGQKQLEVVMAIMLESPSLYMTSMPDNMQGMLNFGEYSKTVQENFATYSYQILSRMLKKKAESAKIDLSELDRVMQLKQVLEVRLGNVSKSSQFDELIEFIVSKLVSGKSAEVLSSVFTSVGSYHDDDLTKAVLNYFFNTYFAKNDYLAKIDAVTRLIPKASAARNKELQRLFESVDYQGMDDNSKKAFLEAFLPLFLTDQKALSLLSEDKKPLHQTLSRDYMHLLSKAGMRLPDLVKKMDEAGAVVTQFDLIVDNQKQWKEMTLEDMRAIMRVVKNSQKGYQKYQFALGTIALSKVRNGTPTLMLSDFSTSGSYNRDDGKGRGGVTSVYPYQEAMEDASDFRKYFSTFITGENSIFAGMTFDESIAFILEFLPNSKERDEILMKLLPTELTENQAVTLIKEFSELEDHGESPQLGLPGTSFSPGGRPVVDQRMMFAYIGLPGDIRADLDAEFVLNLLKAKLVDAGGVDTAQAEKDLTKLRDGINSNLEEYKALVAKEGELANGRFAYLEQIKSDIFKFATTHLIKGNPHFDYFNLKDFKYQYSKDNLRFSISWRVYRQLRAFLENDSVPFADKVKKILQFFPERTSFRDNELEKLVAREEARMLGVAPALIVQQLNLVGLGYEPYEVVTSRKIDISKLSPEQAQSLITLYKSLIPLMTDGTHQIVLGRKIFEMQKAFFPEVYSDFEQGLKEILANFPKFSLARDSVLSEFINMGAVKTYSQLVKVNGFVLELQRLSRENEIVKDAMHNELWNTINKLPSRKEKADFILWLLSPDRPMPESMRKMALHNDVNFDSLPSILFGMTKGERDKFFYDFLRGYNGLFDVNTFTAEEVRTIIAKIISRRAETIQEILTGNNKADQSKLQTAFDDLAADQGLENLAKLFAVIEQQGGSKVKQTAKKMIGLGSFMPLISKLSTLDISTILESQDTVISAISDLESLQDSLQDIRKLLSISSKVGLGRTLNSNIQRLQGLADNFVELRPLINDIIQAFEGLKDADLSNLDRMIAQIGELKAHLETIRQIKSKAEAESENIKAVYEQMKLLVQDISAMRSELDTLISLSRTVEKIGLFSGTAEKFEQVDRLLSLAEDEQIKAVVQQIKLFAEQNFNGNNMSPLEYIQNIESDIQNNYQLENFVSQLFGNVFQPGELGNAEGIMRDIFEGIFNGYSAERRILLFNSLLDIFSNEKSRGENRGKKVRAILEQLGVVGVKIAQYLSEQPQLFVGAEDILIELKNLKKDATPFHNKALFQLVQEEELSDVIVEIQERMQAASVKQVNGVLLKSGAKAAGKFLRPSAEKFLKEDLFVVEQTLRMLNSKHPDIGLPVNMREDLEKMILDELKFELEAANVQRYRENLANRPTTQRNGFTLKAPEIFHQSANVIIEELVHGVTLDDLILLKTDDSALTGQEREKKKGLEQKLEKNFTASERAELLSYDVDQIKDAIIREFFEQTYGEGFYHADMHYGNTMITPKKELYLIDFGSAGSIDQEDVQPLLNLLISIESKDANGAVTLLNRFLDVKIIGKNEIKQALEQEITSDHTIEIKLKNILKIIKQSQLKPNEELLMYLKGLSAVSPTFAVLSDADQKDLVASYMTLRSKARFGARSLLRTLTPSLRSSSSITAQSASAPTVNSTGKKQNLGGIDMNSRSLDLQTEGDGIKFDMPFDPTQLQNIKIDGFSPVILQIIPTNLPLFIGIKDTDKQMQVSSSI